MGVGTYMHRQQLRGATHALGVDSVRSPRTYGAAAAAAAASKPLLRLAEGKTWAACVCRSLLPVQGWRMLMWTPGCVAGQTRS